jgi:hypothetical protein
LFKPLGVGTTAPPPATEASVMPESTESMELGADEARKDSGEEAVEEEA